MNIWRKVAIPPQPLLRLWGRQICIRKVLSIHRPHDADVLPHLAIGLVARHARFDAMHHAALAHLSRTLHHLRRSGQAHGLELVEDALERVRGWRRGRRIVLLEKLDQQGDVFKRLVGSLPEVLTIVRR